MDREISAGSSTELDTSSDAPSALEITTSTDNTTNKATKKKKNKKKKKSTAVDGAKLVDLFEFSPSRSKLIQVVDKSAKGRGLVARKKLSPGTLFFCEKPIAVLTHNQGHTNTLGVCYNCTKEVVTRAIGCHDMSFCSSHCQEVFFCSSGSDTTTRNSTSPAGVTTVGAADTNSTIQTHMYEYYRIVQENVRSIATTHDCDADLLRIVFQLFGVVISNPDSANLLLQTSGGTDRSQDIKENDIDSCSGSQSTQLSSPSLFIDLLPVDPLLLAEATKAEEKETVVTATVAGMHYLESHLQNQSEDWKTSVRGAFMSMLKVLEQHMSIHVLLDAAPAVATVAASTGTSTTATTAHPITAFLALLSADTPVVPPTGARTPAAVHVLPVDNTLATCCDATAAVAATPGSPVEVPVPVPVVSVPVTAPPPADTSSSSFSNPSAPSSFSSSASFTVADYGVYLASIINVNAYGIINYATSLPPTSEAVGFGLFPIVGLCLNHSCAPNCYNIYNFQQGCMEYRTLVEVPAGEELHVSYVDIFEASTAERRQYLHNKRFFPCHCDRCSACDIVSTTVRNICDATGGIQQKSDKQLNGKKVPAQLLSPSQKETLSPFYQCSLPATNNNKNCGNNDNGSLHDSNDDDALLQELEDWDLQNKANSKGKGKAPPAGTDKNTTKGKKLSTNQKSVVLSTTGLTTSAGSSSTITTTATTITPTSTGTTASKLTSTGGSTACSTTTSTCAVTPIIQDRYSVVSIYADAMLQGLYCENCKQGGIVLTSPININTGRDTPSPTGTAAPAWTAGTHASPRPPSSPLNLPPPSPPAAAAQEETSLIAACIVCVRQIDDMAMVIQSLERCRSQWQICKCTLEHTSDTHQKIKAIEKWLQDVDPAYSMKGIGQNLGTSNSSKSSGGQSMQEILRRKRCPYQLHPHHILVLEAYKLLAHCYLELQKRPQNRQEANIGFIAAQQRVVDILSVLVPDAHLHPEFVHELVRLRMVMNHAKSTVAVNQQTKNKKDVHGKQGMDGKSYDINVSYKCALGNYHPLTTAAAAYFK